MLNKLVFYGRYAQRAFLAIGFRDIHPLDQFGREATGIVSSLALLPTPSSPQDIGFWLCVLPMAFSPVFLLTALAFPPHLPQLQGSQHHCNGCGGTGFAEWILF